MWLAYIFAKIPTFPGKNPTSSEEKCLFSAKSSDNLIFLVINSDFLNFYHEFTTKTQKTTTDSLLFSTKTSCFPTKTTRKYIFSGEI